MRTVVTSSTIAVDEWIANVYRCQSRRLHKLVVGLNTEWHTDCSKPKAQRQTVAIVQLCVGHHCLIFKYRHADFVPESLVKFLDNDNFTFVGKGIKTDVKKFWDNCGLGVSYSAYVADMAAKKHKDRSLRGLGLKTLAEKYANRSMEKEENTRRSSWGNKDLSYEQVRFEFRCIDAFVSFELGLKFKDMINSV